DVRTFLLRRQDAVSIPIDVSDDRVGHGNARRELELKRDPAWIDREPRGLKILVQPMRGYLAADHDSADQREHDSRAATCAQTSLRNHWSDRDKSYGYAPRCPAARTR